ncbi:MAG: hypothetical protein KGS72_05100 [Cyanobacteria bacterium REEB67]|nr:hypothetical protein [Cyanobacteria bacterium REEB67]
MHSSVCRAEISPAASRSSAQPTMGNLHFQKSSGYECFDPALAKFEQSATTDLPLQAVIVNGPIRVQMHTRKHAAKNAAGRIYIPNHVASPLLGQETGAMPAFAANVSLREKSEVSAAPSGRRRQLLPAPKTAFLPAGDPSELRQIIRENQQSRSLRIENARATARLNALSLAQARALAERKQSPVLSFAARTLAFVGAAALAPFTAPLKLVKNRLGDLLGDLIDRMALA